MFGSSNDKPLVTTP